MADMRLMKDLMETIRQKDNGPQPYDTQAEVTRVDGGTAWVRIPGSDGETPVQMSINARAGDTVRVRVSGGHAWTVGNDTAPPTDDRTANAAQATATEAQETANTALADAQRAAEAADAAEASAAEAEEAAAAANENLRSVVQGAATVEKAVSVMQTALEAVVEYDPINDTTQEYFWHDANGAHVLGATSGYRNDVTSSGMSIIDTSTEDSVAEFGSSGTRIGKTDESHIEMDSRSMKLVDDQGKTFLDVNDARDSDGNITDTFTGDGVTTEFEVQSPVESVVEVTIDDVVTSAYTRSGRVFTFNTAPVADAEISIKYEPISAVASFTFGTRASGGIGLRSAAIGSINVASGNSAVAIGGNNKASGMTSLAEGFSSWATGRGAHAEGGHTRANGSYSHTQNSYTIADGDSQTVLGKYNIADSSSAVIIGDGIGEGNRSNAVTVDWGGNVNVRSSIDAGNNISAGRNISATGNISAGGTITATGDITSSGTITDGSGNSIPWICCGAASGVSVNANSSNTFDITFPSTAPTSTPRVFAILRATSTAQNRSLIVPVVSAQSATGATVRVFNNGSSNLTGMVFNWIAMA